MARICIITPGPLGSNPRTVKEASALADAGHSVHVISTRTLDAVDQRDDDILSRATWSSRRIDLRNPRRWKAMRVVQLAAGLLQRLGAPTAGFAQSAFVPAMWKAATRYKADLYIAHYPPALTLAAAAVRRNGGLLAFDAEDFHLGDLPDLPEHRGAKALIRAVEGRWLPKCAYVTAASPGIADAYAAAYGGDRPTVILNTFPKDLAPAEPTSAGTIQPGPSLYWFSQTIGPDRGLECAIRAISLSRAKPHLYLRGSVTPDYEQALRQLALESRVEGRLHILPPALPSQMEGLAADYDLGLVSETGMTPNRQIALTNKQFTYFLAGLPALMSDTRGHVMLAPMAPGAAFLFKTEQPEDLALRLDDLLTDPERLRQARQAAYAAGQSRFNWEQESQVLTACVNKALETRP